MIYVLLLENNKWYIGYTNRINGDRFLEHFDEKGSEWTKLHKPIQVMLFKDGTLDDERTTTLEYMEKYGWYNVRGGPWCKVSMIKPPDELIPKNLPKPLNKTKNYIKKEDNEKNYIKKEDNKKNYIKKEDNKKDYIKKEDNKKKSIADNLIELIKIWKNIPDDNSQENTIINNDSTSHISDNNSQENIIINNDSTSHISDNNSQENTIINNDSTSHISDNNSQENTIIDNDSTSHTSNDNFIRKTVKNKKNTLSGTKWTEDEINQLIKELKEKKSIKEITSLHSRSKLAIEAKIKSIIIKMNIKENIVSISNNLCLTEDYVNNLLTQPTFYNKYNKYYR